MSLILNGTDGLSDVDGTAATPAIRGTDANTGIFFPAADTIAFSEGGTEAMRIDSSGNVGIGTSSPTASLTVSSASGSPTVAILSGGTTSTSDNTQLRFFGKGSAANLYAIGTDIADSGTGANFDFFDLVASANRMRITSTGRVFINTTSEAGSNDSQVTIKQNEGAGFYRCLSLETVVSTNRIIQSFINTNGIVGTISTNGSATAYNTSSDYRLKENIAPMTGALTTVAQLKPVTYKWKVDGSDGQGFIAHELQEVVAGCVSGEKDAVDKNGNPEYQGIDTSFLVATLTAALQELNAKVDAQAVRIAELEGAK